MSYLGASVVFHTQRGIQAPNIFLTVFIAAITIALSSASPAQILFAHK
jgi:hypothetical protein